jgi:hypothetical protein
MPIDPTPPMFIGQQLYWDIHSDGPEMTFSVRATAFKYAIGLRPRARADNSEADRLAKRNWAVLELIATEALRSGQISNADASKGWHVHYTLDDVVFTRLFEKHEAQIIR